MTKAERTATAKKDAMMKRMSDKQLVETFEMTENMRGLEIATVRGWLMDEIEERYPDEFDTWLDSDYPADKELRKYIFK